MIAGLLLGAVGLVAGGVGGYYMGGHVSVASMKAELTTLLADAKAEEQALAAKVKAFLARL